MKLARLLCTLPPVLLVTACAVTQRNDVPDLTEMLRETTGQNGRACIRTSDIRGYGLQRGGDAINIDATRDYYIATLRPGCLDIETSMGIIFSNNFNEVCGGRIDTVITQGNECSINQVFKFESRDHAFKAFNDTLERRQQMLDAKK